MISQFINTSAVNLGVIGVLDESENVLRAFVHSAPTSAANQNGAKIGRVVAQYPDRQTNEDVNYLIFWDPDMKYLPIDIFHHFPSVELLEIGRSFQEMISPVNGHFMNAKQLDKIFISNQAFLEMGPNVFEGATNVTRIHLEHNHISRIDQNTFRDARTLKQLSLQGNTISSLESGTFEKLLELEFINLKNNLLTTLPSKIFADNINLKTIMIDNNRILFIKNLELLDTFEKLIMLNNLCVNDEFTKSSDLTKILSKQCTIELSPKNFFESYKDQQENLHNCDIKDIDEVFDLKEQIKDEEMEISKIKTGKERIIDIIRSLEDLQFCHAR